MHAREKLFYWQVNVKALARFHGMTVLHNYYNRHLYNNYEAGFESTVLSSCTEQRAAVQD